MTFSLAQVLLAQQLDLPLARLDANRSVNRAQFLSDVEHLKQRLQPYPDARTWGLYCQGSYAFAVALFALWASGKTPVIASNNTASGEAKLKLHCDAMLGDFANSTLDLRQSLLTPYLTPELGSLDLQLSKLILFTSGSSGQAKAVEKDLACLNRELQALETCFGETLQSSDIVATVSHQHIYGLLFRLLWPLATGRPFWDQQILESAHVLKLARQSQQRICWISSPAHLHRLHAGLDWQASKNHLCAVFSSGGPLAQEHAWQLKQLAGQAAIEVFGSTETGGIAYRSQQPGHIDDWQPLPEVQIKQQQQRLLIRSPHLYPQTESWYPCDDAIELKAHNRFQLKGRLDRIVKLEAKRLSLPELEAAIKALDWIEDCYCFTRSNSARQVLVCAAVLTPLGIDEEQSTGKAALVKRMRQQLGLAFELSTIPRKWRFCQQIPLTSQGKIDAMALQELFHDD